MLPSNRKSRITLKMSSAARLAANRVNATHSTGPRTQQGKSRVAKNAVKLGLFAAKLVIKPEQRRAFRTFSRDHFREAAPATASEHILTLQLIEAAWRMHYCANCEADLIDPNTLNQLDPIANPAREREMNAIDRAYGKAMNQYKRATDALKRLQTTRQLRRLLTGAFDFNAPDLGYADTMSFFNPRRLKALIEQHFPQFLFIAKQTQFRPVFIGAGN